MISVGAFVTAATSSDSCSGLSASTEIASKTVAACSVDIVSSTFGLDANSVAWLGFTPSLMIEVTTASTSAAELFALMSTTEAKGAVVDVVLVVVAGIVVEVDVEVDVVGATVVVVVVVNEVVVVVAGSGATVVLVDDVVEVVATVVVVDVELVVEVVVVLVDVVGASVVVVVLVDVVVASVVVVGRAESAMNSKSTP